MKVNLMFHEIGLKKYSGFYRDDSYKYVISSGEFEELIHLSLKEEKINGTKYEYTFDDGGISNMLSSEILLKNKLKGVFFIPTKFIGCKGFLTKNDIKELHNNGHVVGTHTHNHPRFLNKFNYDDQFFEWSRSSNILSDIIGNKVTVAGAPGGRYNIQTFDIFQSLGIKALYSSIPSNNMYDEFNSVRLFGRMAIERNDKNHKIIQNDYFINNMKYFRYFTLLYLRKIYEF